MTLRALITKIGFDVNETQAKSVENRVKKMGFAMKGFLIGAVAAVAGIGVTAVKAAADMEMLTTQFEVMLGSTEKANAMMSELKTFAATTPFALKDLAMGTQQLLSFGVAENDVVDAMRLLGDTAGGNAEKLNGLVLAYGKVQAKGKASMEEINMLTERGVPIISTLREQLGVTEDAFFKMVSAGKIGRDDITNAFKTMTSEGGIFYQGMLKASQTLHGLFSTLKDVISLSLASIGTVFLPELKKVAVSLATMIDKIRLWVEANEELLNEKLLNFITKFKDIISFLVPLIKNLSPIILGLAAGFVLYNGILLVTAGLQKAQLVIMGIMKAAQFIYIAATHGMTAAQAVFNGVAMANPIGLIVAAIAILVGAIIILVQNWDHVVYMMQLVWYKMKQFGQWLITAYVAYWKFIGNLFYKFVLQPVIKGISILFKWIGNMGSAFAETFSFVGDAFLKLWDFIIGKFPLLGEAVSWLGNIFKNMWEWISDIFTNIWDGIMGAIGKAVDWINKITGKKIERPVFIDKDKQVDGPAFEIQDFLKGTSPEGSTTTGAGVNRGPNISMENTISVTVPEGSNTEAIKTAVGDAARAVFTVELQKILVDAGI